MKTNLFRLAVILLTLQFAGGCTPDDYTYQDISVVDLSQVDRVELVPDQLMVLADGHAQLDLRPMMYTKEGNLIPNDRVKEKWLEYSADGGVAITRYFSTSDVALVGKTLTTRVKIKGTGVESSPVSFQVVAPLDQQQTNEITIPVVVHIIQTIEDIESYRGKYERDRLELLLQKLNNVFSGMVSVNPVGVDTHIRFRLAQYDLYGREMAEPGINRFSIDKISTANRYADFLKEQNLVWPAEQYMNIWLISDQKGEVQNFGATVSDDCRPHYVAGGISVAAIPQGLSLSEFPEGGVFTPAESGIIYKLQELDELDRSYGPQVTNELIYYVGRYLGLMSTCFYSGTGTDYCDDTIDYWPTDKYANNNWYKNASGCYFRAENIMDDPKGVHCSVSKNQCERMRWVLQNCPDRAAWKSDFAFTGK